MYTAEEKQALVWGEARSAPWRAPGQFSASLSCVFFFFFPHSLHLPPTLFCLYLNRTLEITTWPRNLKQMLKPKDFFKSSLEPVAEFRHRIVLMVKKKTFSRLRNLNFTKQKVTLTGSTQVVYLGTNFCQEAQDALWIRVMDVRVGTLNNLIGSRTP